MGKIELVMELENLSIYSPKCDGEIFTEFEKFISNNKDIVTPQLKNDFDAIISVINKMLTDCGARENLFRLEGGNIKAIPLYIAQKRIKRLGTLRLYCIRLSEKVLIIGNGGIKRKNRYEDEPQLLAIVNSLRQIEKTIYNKAKKDNIDYDDYKSLKIIIENITI